MINRHCLNLGMALVALLAAFSISSCGKDEPDAPEISDELSLSSSQLTLLSDKNSTATFSVNSNTRWTVSFDNPSDSEWLLLSSTSGSGNASIVVTALSANTSSKARTATVRVNASNVEEVLSITQLAAYESGCYITMDNWLVLTTSIAFDMHLGSSVSFFYAMLVPVADSAGWTDDKLVKYLEDNTSAMDSNMDTSAISFDYLSANTEYYVVAVGFDAKGNRGELAKEKIRTEAIRNSDPWVSILDMDYNATYFTWTTAPDGYTSKYYQAGWTGAAADIVYYYGEAFAAYMIRDGINSGTVEPLARGDSWQLARNGTSSFTVATWGLNTENKFSSLVNLRTKSVGSSVKEMETPKGAMKIISNNDLQTLRENMMLIPF